MLRALVLVGLVIILCSAIEVSVTSKNFGTFAAGKYYSVVRRDGRDTVINGLDPHALADAYYDNTTQYTNGWSALTVRASPGQSPRLQSYYAGLIEGYATYRITQVYWKTFKNITFVPKLMDKYKAWLHENNAYMAAQIVKHHQDPLMREYWNQVDNVLQQVQGIHAGYSMAFDAAKEFPQSEKLTYFDILMLQLDGDDEDLFGALSPPNFDKMTKDELEIYTITRGHCSALIKYDEKRTNLFMTHSTWDTYSNMLRVFKHIQLPFAGNVSFSSTPGWVASVDDYYITSNGLFVTETTNNIYDTSIYKYVTTSSVLYWIRNTVANRMAKTGVEWAKIFAFENSGTYNNQWMIVDTKYFVSGASKSDPRLLTILEQLPGMIRTASGTDVLDERGFWPSYNVPYFKDIYNASGYLAMYEKHGDSYSYTMCPRARIFSRDAPSAVTMDRVQKLIRYNDFEHDPFSKGNACNSIAARCDLNPASSSKHMAFGQIDAKITDVAGVQLLKTQAQCGPSHDTQPVFAWVKEWDNVPHFGQPQAFPFPWVTFTPQEFPRSQ